MSNDWNAVNAEILARTDLMEAYQAMGVVPSRGQPNERGWVDCHAAGREDSNPSARFNVQTGRYKDYKGGEAIGFFEFAGRYGGFKDWSDARRHFASKAGVALPSSQEPRRPQDCLDFIRTCEMEIKRWCRKKDARGSITSQAVLEAGGRMALYPKGLSTAQEVIAFPGYGPDLLDGEPVGWVMVGLEEPVRLYQSGLPDTFHKVLVAAGSGPCLLNRFALERLENAEVVWKVEGISDMLTLQSWIPPSHRDSHVVVTGAFGAMEPVQGWQLRVLEGKTVYVVGDADESGQKGAESWAGALAFKSKAFHVKLPFEVQSDSGMDLRDLCAQANADFPQP